MTTWEVKSMLYDLLHTFTSKYNTLNQLPQVKIHIVDLYMRFM